MLDLSEEELKYLSPEDLAYIQWQVAWMETARDNQLPPDEGWTECGFMAGRGFGKTRVGAEWLGRVAWEDPQALPRAVIAPTQQDVRFTCFEGESGLLSVIPDILVEEYNKTNLVLTLKNGATIRGFSAEKADRLRGPQHADVWCDELAAWGAKGKEVWDMMMFGLRLGPEPRALWTTTPKPVEVVRELTKPKEKRIIVAGSTFDNRDNLPDSFFDQLEQYEGTKLGRQELYGELIDPEEAGIVKRSDFKLWPRAWALPAFQFIVVSLDTAFTQKTMDKKSGDPDPTACGVWGVFMHDDEPNVMLLDCWEDHLGFPDLERRAKAELNKSYGTSPVISALVPLIGEPLIGAGGGKGRSPDMLLIEDKGSGISLRQSLAESGIEAFPYNPGRADKLTRLHIVSPLFAKKKVWLPESDRRPGQPMSWTDPVVEQLCTFTGEGSIKHDDHVDQTTQALRVLTDLGYLSMFKRPTVSANVEISAPPQPTNNPYAQ